MVSFQILLPLIGNRNRKNDFDKLFLAEFLLMLILLIFLQKYLFLLIFLWADRLCAVVGVPIESTKNNVADVFLVVLM